MNKRQIKKQYKGRAACNKWKPYTKLDYTPTVGNHWDKRHRNRTRAWQLDARIEWYNVVMQNIIRETKMTKDEQTIANLKKLKSIHNGSYGADIDRAIKVMEQESAFRKKAEIVISQLRVDRDRLQGAFDKIGVEILKASVEDYKYHGCGTDDLIIETSEVLKIIDKYKTKGEE